MRHVDRVTIPTHFAESITRPTVVDHHNPTIKVILKGEEISGCIVDGGSGVNNISKATCNRLGITNWEVCPVWLRMADTRSVRPLELLRKLEIIVGDHTLKITVIVLALDARGAYPLLQGGPWLRSTNIK